MAGLWDALKQYIGDALPGGALNPETQPVATRANYLSGILDPASQVSQDAQNWHKRTQNGLMDQLAGRDTPEAEQAYQTMMQAAGVAPVGILRRADLKPGGPHFGNWELQNVERRTRLEDVVDPVTGEAKAKRVADMDNAETSWGSGKPIANIYWMKDKKTGELKPFGDDTAHYAMGKESSAEAKKIFNAEWAKEQDKWLSNEAAKYGIETQNMGNGSMQANLYTHPATGARTPTSIVNLREWLIRDQLSRDQVAERLSKYFGNP